VAHIDDNGQNNIHCDKQHTAKITLLEQSTSKHAATDADWLEGQISLPQGPTRRAVGLG